MHVSMGKNLVWTRLEIPDVTRSFGTALRENALFVAHFLVTNNLPQQGRV